MRRSIATVSLSGTLEVKLASAARARFDAVEIFENDLIYSNRTPAEVRERARDLGLGIDLYQPFRDFEGMPDPQFRRSLDRAERKFDVMQALGAPLLLVCSNVSPLASNDVELAAAQLHELADRAGRRGLRIAYEALAWGRHVRNYLKSWEIVARADHPHLGLCLDSFHILSVGDDPRGIEQIPAEKIFFLQLADAPHLVMDVLQWSRHFRCFPGQGAFDLPAFMEHVLVAGYNGPLSLEVFNDIFREASTERTAGEAMQSLLLLEEQTRQRLETRKPAVPGVLKRLELFDPPEPAGLSGTAFIEFAVDAASGRELEALLMTLGFHRVGHHRSKAVTLLRQGEINLVINREPGSAASEHFSVHGPSVCAIALRADDAVRALNRATAFQVPRVDGRLGPGETVIPAIRALDGSLLYFISPAVEQRDFWASDFVVEQTATTGAGLTHVDHVALALPFEQFDAGLLYYRTVLGLQPEESLELVDPYGLVRSRALTTADGSIRLALNVSQSRSTTTARTVSALQGAGVHHIAFACDDVLEAARQLRGQGLKVLAISPNYYEDLPAKFDLDPSRIAGFQAFGVLYDRTDAGEFLHLYTEVFAGRFFFEIVQRVGGYRGYGASNAPVRMAAQAIAAAGANHP